MKTKSVIFTVVLFFSLCLQSNSQGYVKLINDSIYWDIAVADNGYICLGFSDSQPWRTYFNGDSSLINGKVYYHMYSYGFIDVDGEIPTCPPFIIDTVPSLNPVAFIREDGAQKKVYIFEPWENNERLLFDFSLEVGDPFYTENYGELLVDDVSIFETSDGISRKRIEFGAGLGYMIEGLGGPAGPYLDPLYYFEQGQWLLCIEGKSGNGIMIDYCYDFLTDINESSRLDTKIEIYPNPFKNYLNIKCDDEIQHIQLSNIFGVIVKSFDVSGEDYTVYTSDLKEGIYILTIIDKSNIRNQRKLIKINSL